MYFVHYCSTFKKYNGLQENNKQKFEIKLLDVRY